MGVLARPKLALRSLAGKDGGGAGAEAVALELAGWL